tara:strand:- start:2884 stop:3165 length:282 start_codon:yes stop_codon:yes gene_type:complete
MSEEKKGGFFSQIKNQIITTIGLIITAAGGLVITNMEAIFGVAEETVEEQPMMEQTINIPKATKDTVVISKTIVLPPKKEKTETEKRKEEFNW